MKKIILLCLTIFTVGVFGRSIIDTVLKIGSGADADVKIEMGLGKGASNPYLNYDTTSDKFQFCNEGSACEDMGSGSGGGTPLMAKGSLLTSNGAANGEFVACADGDIIEWDSAEAAGFKCVTPSAGGGGLSYATTAGYTNLSFSSVGSWGTVPTLTLTITTGANPVIIRALCGQGMSLAGDSIAVTGVFGGQNGSTASGGYRIVRDGTYVVSAGRLDGNGDYGCGKFSGIDAPTAGLHTYTLQVYNFNTNGMNFTNVSLGAIY